MAVVRMHRYTVSPADFGELVTRRTELVAAFRAAHPGLNDATLIRLDNGTFADIWRWDTAEQMQAAIADLPNFPQARATRSLTKDATALDGEIVD